MRPTNLQSNKLKKKEYIFRVSFVFSIPNNGVVHTNPGRPKLLIFVSTRICCVVVSGLDSPILKKKRHCRLHLLTTIFFHSSSMARTAFMFKMFKLTKQGLSDSYGWV